MKGDPITRDASDYGDCNGPRDLWQTQPTWRRWPWPHPYRDFPYKDAAPGPETGRRGDK